MWKPVVINVERLRPEYFAPYGHLISSVEERKPDIVKGNYSSYEKHAYSEISATEPKDDPSWYAANKNRTPLSEGLKRGYFAFHTDAGQSFFPENGRPTVYIVGGVGEPLRPNEMRAFYGEGLVGVCLHLGVWHTMPMCVDGEELYTTIRGDADYHEHSTEVEFDLQHGLVIAPDLENFNPNA